MQTERKKYHKHDESERDAYRLLPKPENPIGIDEAIEIFVKHVQKIDYVDEVRCYQRGGCHEVWTIITAPRGEYELMSPIIEIEGDVLRRIEDLTLGFRIINIESVDYENAFSGSSSLWKKPDAK